MVIQLLLYLFILGVANYEFVFCQMIFPTEIQWIKFDGSTANQRLWVVAYEYDTYPQNSFNAFGLRYSNLNPVSITMLCFYFLPCG